MEVGAEDEVHFFRTHAGRREVGEEGPVAHVPRGAGGARLVVADAGIDEDGVPLCAYDVGLYAHHEPARLRIHMARHEPARVRLEHVGRRVGK